MQSAGNLLSLNLLFKEPQRLHAHDIYIYILRYSPLKKKLFFF